MGSDCIPGIDCVYCFLTVHIYLYSGWTKNNVFVLPNVQCSFSNLINFYLSHRSTYFVMILFNPNKYQVFHQNIPPSPPLINSHLLLYPTLISPVTYISPPPLPNSHSPIPPISPRYPTLTTPSYQDTVTMKEAVRRSSSGLHHYPGECPFLILIKG